jgi:hypothetical protein
MAGLYLQAESDEVPQIFSILARNILVFARSNGLEQSRKIFGPERRSQRAHLIDDASQGPNIALVVVLKSLPYLGTGVVGRTGLSGGEAIICNFGDI